MALIKCVECGKEISDKAVACPHCGCPVFKQNENQTNAKEIFDETIFNNSEDFSSDNAVTPEQNTTGEVENINSTVPLQPNVKKKKLKGWHKALIGIASVVCIIGVLFVVLILIPAIKAVNSYNEIAPYLDYVGNSHSDVDEAITLTEEEYNNIDKVKLLGMEGEVSFQLRDGYISSCTWTSNDFCSEEKYRAFADDLYILFDSEPKVEDYSYGNGNTYRYYWTDSYYDLDVSMAHGFFAYDPDGKIEIKWEVPEDTIEEGISENEGEEGTLKDNIKMVETLFSLNYEEIFSEYPNAELEYPDNKDIKNVNIEESFAGLSGLYNVCVSGDGTVWRVIFEPEDESLADESVVDVISASLGDYIDYDSEWDYYTWKTDNLEIAYWIDDRTYIDWIGGDLEVNEITEDENEEKDDFDESEIGVVENIHTAADIPNELMNDEFKNVIDLFSKGFSQSGLDIANGTTYNDGETYIFYFDNLEFLGDECEEGSNFNPRIIYDQDAINNDGTPYKMFFAFANPLKSNGYEETVEMVEDIAEALDISDAGLIDNNYSSSSKLAIGKYATFTFPNLGLEFTVSNTDGTVEIEIIPILESKGDDNEAIEEEPAADNEEVDELENEDIQYSEEDNFYEEEYYDEYEDEYIEPSLIVDTTPITLTDSAVTIYVTMTGCDSIECNYYSRFFECYWGEWEGDVIPLTIEPVGEGTDTLEIYTENYELYAEILVTVVE